MDREEVIRKCLDDIRRDCEANDELDGTYHVVWEKALPILRDFADELSAAKPRDELEKGQTTVCPTCEGSGYDVEDIVERNRDGDPELVGRHLVGPCPTCHGSGRIPTEAAILLATVRGMLIAADRLANGEGMTQARHAQDLEDQAAALIEGRK